MSRPSTGETPTRELREAYEIYCSDLGEKPLAANVLGRRLTAGTNLALAVPPEPVEAIAERALEAERDRIAAKSEDAQ